MEEKEIVITRFENKFVARVAGDKDQFGLGNSPDEALGVLIRGLRENFNIKITDLH